MIPQWFLVIPSNSLVSRTPSSTRVPHTDFVYYYPFSYLFLHFPTLPTFYYFSYLYCFSYSYHFSYFHYSPHVSYFSCFCGSFRGSKPLRNSLGNLQTKLEINYCVGPDRYSLLSHVATVTMSLGEKQEKLGNY